MQRRAVDAYNSDGERLDNVVEEPVVDPDEDDLPFNHWALFRRKFQLPLAEWLGTTMLVCVKIHQNRENLLTIWSDLSEFVVISVSRRRTKPQVPCSHSIGVGDSL